MRDQVLEGEEGGAGCGGGGEGGVQDEAVEVRRWGVGIRVGDGYGGEVAEGGGYGVVDLGGYRGGGVVGDLAFVGLLGG